MTTDTELQTWQQEWRDHTEPLPEWKRKIRRQNLWTAAAIVALCLCLAFATLWAWRSRTSFAIGFAVGLWVASTVAGSYAWWVRRGAWRPTAQTTLAYMELLHRRAVAKARQLRFSFYFLLLAILGFAGFMAWDWKGIKVRDVAIVAALAMELFFFRHYGQRKRREIEETKKLIEEMK